MYKERGDSLRQRNTTHTHGCAHPEELQRTICTPLLFFVLNLSTLFFVRVHSAQKGELSVLDANRAGSNDAPPYLMHTLQQTIVLRTSTTCEGSVGDDNGEREKTCECIVHVLEYRLQTMFKIICQKQ